MAESASKQLLSALTEGHEKGNSKAATKKSSKASAKVTASGKVGNQGGSRNHRSVASGGQTVTSSSKCKFVQLTLHNNELIKIFYF